MTRSADFVQSLDRGLAIIRAFDTGASRLTLSDIARATGLNRAVARRFLHTLVALGYVRTDGKLFALRPKVLELSHAYLCSLRLPEVATVHLATLVERVCEPSSISVLDGNEVRCVAWVSLGGVVRMVLSGGAGLPAHATAAGRVLLAGQPDEWLDGYLAGATRARASSHAVVDVTRLRAELKRVRSDGHALMNKEPTEGARCLAVPVRDRDGTVVAAVSVSGRASISGGIRSRDTRLVPLLEAAAAIEHDLQVWNPRRQTR